MKHLSNDTIAAIATPIGTGGVAIIRLSGSRARAIATSVFRPAKHSKITSHKMIFGYIYDKKARLVVDQGLLCYMQAPRSYTREDVVEIYCHGGLAVVRQILKIVLANGARLADKGEFTKRAYLSGQLDLVQAEAVLDLVKAPTSRGAGLAVSQLRGRLSDEVKALLNKLMALAASLEATIDFSDDIKPLKNAVISRKIKQVESEVVKLLSFAWASKIYRHGLAIAIVGQPNVGKSSMLNSILHEERAIVTDMPGTTRDTIEEAFDLNGLPIRLIDTAGLRAPGNKAEAAGIDRANKEASAADLVLVVIDGSAKLSAKDKEILSGLDRNKTLLVINKLDLGLKLNIKPLKQLVKGGCLVKVSALTGQGMSGLIRKLNVFAAQKLEPEGQAPILINERHEECLKKTLEALKTALLACSRGEPLDLIAIALKGAISTLGALSGVEISDQVINKIFEQFCVGK